MATQLNESNPYTPPDQTSAGASSNSSLRLRYGGILGVTSLVAAITFIGWMFLLSSGPSWFALIIGGLISSPYLLIFLAALDLQFWAARLIATLGFVACCTLGVYAFAAVDDDAQGGLNLIFAPIYQIGGMFVLLLVAVVVDRAWRRYAFRSVPDCGSP